MPASALVSGPILPNGPVLCRNLDALDDFQPEIRRRLAAIQDFNDARIVTGSDGHKVVLRSAGTDRIAWLGGSSMPSVSAAAILSGQADRRCNILLPTAGSGHEIRLLAQRLDNHCAVFAYEPDDATMAMVLSVVDLSDIIQHKRLVLLTGSLEEALIGFLRQHSGYDFPGKLYHHPTLDRGTLEARSRAVRAAAHRWQQDWRRLLTDAAAGVSRLRPDATTDRPRLLVISMDTSMQVGEHAARIERAARTLNWPTHVCIPDRPDRVNVLARIGAFRDHGSDLLVIVNGTSASVGANLPDDLPRACWFLESPALSAGALHDMECEPCIQASSDVVRDILVRRGAQPAAISTLEEGVDESPATIAAGSPESPRAPADALLYAHLLDDSPEAAGITLETHTQLWRQLVVEVKRHAGQLHGRDLARCLQAAQQSCGIDLQDDSMCNELITLAERRLWPSALAEAALACLTGVVSRIYVCGSGWQRTAHPAVDWMDPPGNTAKRWTLLSSARLLVVPHTDAFGLNLATEAVLVDTLPIMRVSDSDIKRHRPQTHGILRRLPWFKDPVDLAVHVRHWLEHDTQRHTLLADMRDTLLSEHSTASRLRQLMVLARQQARRRPGLSPA